MNESTRGDFDVSNVHAALSTISGLTALSYIALPHAAAASVTKLRHCNCCHCKAASPSWSTIAME